MDCRMPSGLIVAPAVHNDMGSSVTNTDTLLLHNQPPIIADGLWAGYCLVMWSVNDVKVGM